MPISFFGGGRQFFGSLVDNANPAQVLSFDQESGSPPVLYIRAWNSNASGQLQLYGQSAPAGIDFFTRLFGLSDSSSAVDIAADHLKLYLFDVVIQR
jgi:hypothetical protein